MSCSTASSAAPDGSRAARARRLLAARDPRTLREGWTSRTGPGRSVRDVLERRRRDAATRAPRRAGSRAHACHARARRREPGMAPALGGVGPTTSGRSRMAPPAFLTKDDCATPTRSVRVRARVRLSARQMSSGTTGNPILNPYTQAELSRGRGDGPLLRGGRVTASTSSRSPLVRAVHRRLRVPLRRERLGAWSCHRRGRTLLQLKPCAISARPCHRDRHVPLRRIEVAREERFDLRSLALRVECRSESGPTSCARHRARARAPDVRHHRDDGDRRPGLGTTARRGGIHVWEDHYHVEIVDPLTAMPSPTAARRADRLDADTRGPAARAVPYARPHGSGLARARRMRRRRCASIACAGA